MKYLINQFTDIKYIVDTDGSNEEERIESVRLTHAHTHTQSTAMYRSECMQRWQNQTNL